MLSAFRLFSANYQQNMKLLICVLFVVLCATDSKFLRAFKCQSELAARSSSCAESFHQKTEHIHKDELYQGSDSSDKFCDATNDFIRCLNSATPSEDCKNRTRGHIDGVVLSQAEETKKTLKCANVATATVSPVTQGTVMLTSSALIVNFMLILQTTLN